MQIEIGSHAPDFELKDQNGRARCLSNYRGHRNVVLVFYPLAFSGICTTELCELRDDLAVFENDHTATLAVSVDSPYALKAFADEQGYKFTLLSDFWPHGEVARLYGVFNSERGFANRGTFIIDTDGVVRFVQVNSPGEPRDAGAYRAALARL
jgi:peroxiredoxin